MGILSAAAVRFSLTGTVSQTLGGATDSMALNAAYTTSIDNGTSSGMGNSIVSIKGTVTSGTPADINLQALALAGLTDSTTLTNMKAIMIQHQGTVTGRNLQIGDSAGTLTNGWTAPFLTAAGGITIGMGGAVALSNDDVGYTVDSTHKVLRLQSSSGAIPYQIDIIGVE